MRDHGLSSLLGLFLGTTLAVFGEPEVNTTFGPVRGVWMKSRGGDDFAGFLGLPYAEPPVGDLRLENPRPWNQNWTDIRNATTDGPECMQIDKERGLIGDEDCLYLNVFTPTVSRDLNDTDDRKLPVLVFVHGGSFIQGSSKINTLPPKYLLDYEVVLVTLNYRLNVMGFFSTGNDVAPGNYGLKDVVAALHWVQSNIEAFGGDPKSVTLAGQSAGSAIAQLLSSTRKTEGLFHKLVTMSGAATSNWSVRSREYMRSSSLRVAELLGCKNETEQSGGQPPSNATSARPEIGKKVTAKEIDRQIVECVKKANASEIVQNSIYEVWRGSPISTFAPTLEAEAEGAILTVHPVQSLEEGLFRDLPWLTGVTSDEGLIKSADMFLNSQIKAELIKDFENLTVPYLLELDNVFDNVSAVTQLIQDFYFNNSILKNFESNVTQMTGDGGIVYSVYDFLQKQSAKMKSNVYFYQFAYEGTFSTTFRWGFPFRFGVSHTDDLNYLFPFLNLQYADLQLFNTVSDTTMINIMCEMWTNFAKLGVPSAWLTETWEPYQKSHRFMKLGDKRETVASMQEDFLAERMAFWAEVMANYSLPIKEVRVDGGKRKSKSAASTRPACTLFGISFTILCLWWGSLF